MSLPGLRQLTSAQSCLEQARRALEAAQREADAIVPHWGYLGMLLINLLYSQVLS